MKKIFVILMISFACISCSKSGDSSDQSMPGLSPAITSPELVTLTSEFMSLLNAHRKKLNLPVLTLDNDLSELASDHSSDMADQIVPFGHTGFSDRCSEGRSIVGSGNWCSENVAQGQKTVQTLFTAWLNSSGHRANMENSKATHTGFGYQKSAAGVRYWTQIFLQKSE